MAWSDTEDAPLPDTYNLDILATVACLELERLKRLEDNKTIIIPKQKRSKRPAAVVRTPAEPPVFKKLKAEEEAVEPILAEPPAIKKLEAEEKAAEPIFSSVGTDLALTLIKTNKKKKKALTLTLTGPPPLREAPSGLKEMVAGLNGSEAILVAEKPLTDSDVKRNLGRLQIPESQMNQFLSGDESDYLKIKIGNKMNGIAAPLHQFSGGGDNSGYYCSGVMVKRWEMMKSNGSAPSIMYVLTTGWNDVVARNKLKAGDMVQVWSFRVDHKLHLALLLL